MKRGFFIVLEGGEGSGKSTHSKRLKENLKKEGYRVILTKEPGGTRIGTQIRRILLKEENIDLVSLAELFLFLADRAQHVNQVIKPALKEGKVVICDRFSFSSLAYQGYGRKIALSLIKWLDRIATGGLRPDLVILLDVDPEKGLERSKKAGNENRFEKEPLEFHQRVNYGFKDLAKRNGHIIIDASLSKNEVERQILEAVLKKLKPVSLERKSFKKLLAYAFANF